MPTRLPADCVRKEFDAGKKLYIAVVGIPPYAVGPDWYNRRSAAVVCSQDLVSWHSPGSDDDRLALPLTAREIDAAYQGGLSLRGNPYSNSSFEVMIAADSADDALAYERALVRQRTRPEKS